MKNDRIITITTGGSRKETCWKPQTLLLSEFWEKLRLPARGKETVAQYLALPKAKQDELKDVGGYVAGAFSGPRRKADAVTGRELITLDLDNIPAGAAQEVARRVEALGCGYCLTSTRKHRPDAPRLRLLLPLDRTCSADEYEPCARYVGKVLGLELCDPSTFEASRLMYWCRRAVYLLRGGQALPFCGRFAAALSRLAGRDILAPGPGRTFAGKTGQKAGRPSGKGRRRGGVLPGL